MSLMCNVMSEELYYYQQDTIVLFSEATLRQGHRASCNLLKALKRVYGLLCCRGLQKKYITTDMVEMMDPVIMFAIPRLAIVWLVAQISLAGVHTIYLFVLM